MPDALRRLTIEEFQRLHGQISAKPPASKPPFSAPKIEVPFFAPIAASLSLSTVEPISTEAQRFTATLLGILQAAYSLIGEEEKSLSCPVEFTLRSDGGVVSCKIRRSSGSRLFDEAVLTALKGVKVNAPPVAFIGIAIHATFQVLPRQ